MTQIDWVIAVFCGFMAGALIHLGNWVAAGFIALIWLLLWDMQRQAEKKDAARQALLTLTNLVKRHGTHDEKLQMENGLDAVGVKMGEWK